MPQLVDITTNTADGSLTWAGIVPSAGDRSWSVNRTQESRLPGNLRTLEFVSRNNQSKTARRVDLKITQPYVTTVNGVEVADTKIIFSASLVLPMNIPAGTAQAYADQIGQLLSADVVQEVLSNGYAPT